MNFLFTLLQTGAAATQGSSIGFWVMIALMLAVMYFFMIRPQRKQQKELQKFS